ncbi:hypothetical protein EX30DRAFT_90719 [Ascodesmis nigricans]|uniref:G-patch domain-containing protein n=1 Tax=Ascodesmis nigricans TaxID=341454 RepID=A0A4S2N3B8_9PEZI|nr:hypothetical protein EX30DRAFT_90719 [Ascodesmis nigricans]
MDSPPSKSRTTLRPSRSRSPRRDDSPPHDSEAWRRIRPYHRHPPIHFIPASDPSTTTLPPTITTPKKTPAEDVAANYLAIVGLAGNPAFSAGPTETVIPTVCDICKLPITTSMTDHERSTAHQAALPHSFPPHPHPRRSVGLKVLEKAGWDPDARVGLGREGQGRRYPIKAVEKKDRIGVGADLEEVKKAVEKEKKLGVKEMAKLENAKRKMREKMNSELSGNIDWSLIDGGKHVGLEGLK